MIIQHLLKWGQTQVSESPSAYLDCEVLLAHCLSVSRSYLYAHPEQKVTMQQSDQFQSLVMRRQKGEPIAYLVGKKEFWSLPFQITPAVLIPRPETELLVELILQEWGDKTALRIADLGTGSGIIALALAHERPHWTLVATDQNKAALEIARLNAQQLKLNNVNFYQGNWCEAFKPNESKFHIIVSNPPYIAPDDIYLSKGDVRFEPILALVSENKGLQAIEHLCQQVKNHLHPNGYFYLEHGWQQGENVRLLFTQNGWKNVTTIKDYQGHERVTFGCICNSR